MNISLACIYPLDSSMCRGGVDLSLKMCLFWHTGFSKCLSAAQGYSQRNTFALQIFVPSTSIQFCLDLQSNKEALQQNVQEHGKGKKFFQGIRCVCLWVIMSHTFYVFLLLGGLTMYEDYACHRGYYLEKISYAGANNYGAANCLHVFVFCFFW